MSLLVQLFNLIADAIREKKGTTDKIPAESFPDEIRNLDTSGSNGGSGIDTNDATAVSSEILYGKTAYVKGEKVTGIMPNNGELNYIPLEEAQVIPEGYTSGGTISPVDITTLNDYKVCEDLADDILGGIV